MHLTVLDNLHKPDALEGDLEGNFIYKGNEVSISISPDDIPIEETLKLAKKFLSKLELYETKSLERVSEEYLPIYNEDWRQDSAPILSKKEFFSNFTLIGLGFLSNDIVHFYFSENGMFGNHSIIPTSFDGENFTYVDMYG